MERGLETGETSDQLEKVPPRSLNPSISNPERCPFNQQIVSGVSPLWSESWFLTRSATMSKLLNSRASSLTLFFHGPGGQGVLRQPGALTCLKG